MGMSPVSFQASTQLSGYLIPATGTAAGRSAAAGEDQAAESAPADRRSVVQEAARPGVDAQGARPPEEQAEIQELKRRDQEVRQHEAAHMAAGGPLVRGGASYSYAAGPDGKRYAVGGEVSIDVSPVAGDPAATAAKMQVVRRAALAPGRPSGQDLAVAARASQAEASARMEAAKSPEKGTGPRPPRPVPGRSTSPNLRPVNGQTAGTHALRRRRARC